MELKDIKPKIRFKKPKRLGRGHGSGHGKTSGRGHKGAKSRSGRLWYIGFEGDSLPFFRKIPKRGFNHRKRVEYQLVNVQDLNSRFKKEDKVMPEGLFKKGLIKDKDEPVKILGKGALSKPLSVSAHKFSERAKQKIEKSGGKIECLTL